VLAKRRCIIIILVSSASSSHIIQHVEGKAIVLKIAQQNADECSESDFSPSCSSYGASKMERIPDDTEFVQVKIEFSTTDSEYPSPDLSSADFILFRARLPTNLGRLLEVTARYVQSLFVAYREFQLLPLINPLATPFIRQRDSLSSRTTYCGNKLQPRSSNNVSYSTRRIIDTGAITRF
jgi:hypothetical protein